MRYPAPTAEASEAYLDDRRSSAKPILLYRYDPSRFESPFDERLLPYLDEFGYTHVYLPADVFSSAGSKERITDFVKRCHEAEIGVLLPYSLPDMPTDAQTLASDALSTLRAANADGLCFIGLAKALYLPEGEANPFGGTESIEGFALVRTLTDAIRHEAPGVLLIACEGFRFPLATAPTALGGLGFDFVLNARFSDDTALYARLAEGERRYHHELVSYQLIREATESWLLTLNDLAPAGDEWQQAATQRLLYGYMTAYPGAKCLSVPADAPQSTRDCAKALCELYRTHPALYEHNDLVRGFRVISTSDVDNSVFAFERVSDSGDTILCVCSFSSFFHPIYRIGLPRAGMLTELFNSDRAEYGGSNQYNAYDIYTMEGEQNGFPCWAEICVPPLGCVYFKYQTVPTTMEGGQQ